MTNARSAGSERRQQAEGQPGSQDGEEADPGREAHFHKAREAQSRVLLEDYVELIAELLRHPGDTEAEPTVGPSRIARHLGVSHASAIKCINRLCRGGLARTQPYRGVSLTAAGRSLAASVQRRHRIVLTLLLALGVPEESAQADAEGIEHHVSPATLHAFERFLAEAGRRPDQEPEGSSPG